jgi:hypothetical protein
MPHERNKECRADQPSLWDKGEGEDGQMKDGVGDR